MINSPVRFGANMWVLRFFVMDDVLFTNIELAPDTLYFIYIGEIKAYSLTSFLQETLAKESKKKVDCIAIIPDVLENYPIENVMVINPMAGELASEAGKRVHCRISARSFGSLASQNAHVHQLIKKLLKTQREVFIYLFESLPDLTLDSIAGVRIIGPDKGLSNKWNNKINQHEVLKDVVPTVPFRICGDREEAFETIHQMAPEWNEGIYVCLSFGAAGSNSCVLFPEHESEDIFGHNFKNVDGPYLLSRFIPHEYDPTVLAVVANDNDVYIGGVADQRIADLNKFRGSTFPSVLPDKQIARLKEYTKRIGKTLGRTGYRGIYGCDFLIDDRDDILFLEVNARKQGTTMEMCCTLENSLPPGSPSLPELEYRAVTEGRFPQNTIEMEGNPRSIHWGTYNYKLDNDVFTNGSVAPAEDERTMFRAIAASSTEREAFCVVEHIGKDCLVKAGSFLGRVISVATSRPGVLKGLERGKRMIKETIGEVIIS
jgi:hypothetical protein